MDNTGSPPFARISPAFAGGVSEFQLGHFEGAVRRLEEAAYASPDDVRILMWLASAYLHNRQIDAAVSVYRRLSTSTDPRVRRFAENGLRCCLPGFVPEKGKAPLPPPVLSADSQPPSRSAALSLRDVCVAAWRIAGEERGSFWVSSAIGLLWLFGTMGGAALVLWATLALSGSNFEQVWAQLSRGRFGQPWWFSISLLTAGLLVAWGAGAWLAPLLAVQRWTYYVYVGQEFPFWQARRSLLGRLSPKAWSLVWALLLWGVPPGLLMLAWHSRSLPWQLGWAAAACLCLFLATRWVAVLPVLAVEERGPLQAARRSWQLTGPHSGGLAILALLLSGLWPVALWLASGAIVQVMLEANLRPVGQLLCTAGLYSCTFPLLGTLLGTVFYDLTSIRSEGR